MISGVRGCGKTVFMTDVSQVIGKDKDWIVVDLSPYKSDLMQESRSLSEQHSGPGADISEGKTQFLFIWIWSEVSHTAPIADIQVALERMIENLAQHHKKILFTIDEVTASPQIKAFTFAVQQMLRKNAPVFLLMTGLYQNISNLQNEKNLTFLYRAPKNHTLSANIGAMRNYRQNIKLTADDARDGKAHKGVSFCVSGCGLFLVEGSGKFYKSNQSVRQYLEEQSYEKIWSELSKQRP